MMSNHICIASYSIREETSLASSDVVCFGIGCLTISSRDLPGPSVLANGQIDAIHPCIS